MFAFRQCDAYNRLQNNTPLHKNTTTNADVPESWKTKVKANETYRPCKKLLRLNFRKCLNRISWRLEKLSGLIKKYYGSTIICLDFRKLNSITKKNVYPLNRTDDALHLTFFDAQ